MKILYCISTLEGGGAERQLALLLKAVCSLHHEVHVIYIRGGVNEVGLKDAGVHLHKVPPSLNSNIGVLLYIGQLVVRNNFDLIHTWLTQMDVLAGLIAKISKTPQIISERSGPLAYENDLRNKLRVFIGCKCSAIIPNSLSGKQYWDSNSYRGLIKIIPNAISIDHKKELNIDHIKNIVFAGRLIDSKNVICITLAIKLVIERYPEVKFHYYGVGPLDKIIRKMIHKFSYQEVLYLHGYDINWLKYSSNNSIFISISDYEGCPNSVIEAAANYLPMVLSDIPEHRYIFDDKCVKYVDCKDPHSVSRGIIELLDSNILCRQKAHSSFEKVKDMAQLDFVSNYIDLYSVIIKNNLK